jgi:hypothetical protein
MPFLAERHDTDDLILPHEAQDWMELLCPVCEGSMHLRDSYYNQEKYIPKHFAHTSRGDDCSAESATHLRMKGIAGAKLNDQFDTATINVESKITDSRIADLVVEFDSPLYRLGQGIAVECQYRNKDKQLGKVTGSYLDAGYSILWVYPDDFDFEYMGFDFPEDRIITQWPNAVPELLGDELYPENVIVQHRKSNVDIDPPGAVPATFPPEVRQIHQLDIACPVRDGYHPSWREHSKRGLHTKGRHRTWITLYGHPDVGSFFELRTVDTETHADEFISVPITADSKMAFKTFCENGQMQFEINSDSSDDNEGSEASGESNPDVADTSPPTQFSKSITFEYNAGLQGVFGFTIDESERKQFQLTQHDVLGIERAVNIPYRQGDFKRLSDIIPVFDHLLSPQYPFQAK